MMNDELVDKVATLEVEVASLKLAVRELLDRVGRDKSATPFTRPRATGGLDASDPIGG